MTGGLMNIVAQGNENVYFNGNPKKTFFKATYNKYTNFGLQRFRIDFEGSKSLNYLNPTKYSFKVPRYADLLHDTYIVINLPNIYSSFYFPPPYDNKLLTPYEFRWVKELGGNMISEIEITSGGSTLVRYDGEYIICKKERDYPQEKKELWDRMTGNVVELNDPGSSYGNVNLYPNVMYKNANVPIEPSIRGRKLYIPLSSFFCESSKVSLPLVALQYQEITINIEFRSIVDLFTINNVDDPYPDGSSYRIRSNPNLSHHQLWNFLQPPGDTYASPENYIKINEWNSDIHLIGTYVFLSNNERRIFAAKEHKYLIKQVYMHEYLKAEGSQIVKVESKDMVSNYMWRFRRSDVKLRNEWNNYSNWAYENVKPQNLDIIQIPGLINPNELHHTGDIGEAGNTLTQYPVNLKDILLELGIVLNGVYRENLFDSGLYNFIEKFKRSKGGAKNGLYFYSYSLENDSSKYQPSGAMNVNKFNNITFEYETIETPFDASGSQVDFICDANQNAIGFRNTTIRLNQYGFHLKIYEERYNVMIIQGGRLGLMHAR